jgi:hypothetical protein
VKVRRFGRRGLDVGPVVTKLLGGRVGRLDELLSA